MTPEQAADILRDHVKYLSETSLLGRAIQMAEASLRLQVWRDMSTAPKDGRDILGHLPNGEVHTMWWVQGEGWNNCEGYVIEPTHWLPLMPEPQPTCGNCGKACKERYCDACHAARMKALDELAAESQQLGLYEPGSKA